MKLTYKEIKGTLPETLSEITMLILITEIN